jgi:NAD(P)-dependent dehydrogenase (short-subunit alcohol dehydrogenase family)
MKKKVLVTGANKGIGYGIANHLGLQGWEIIIGARNEERAEKAISELKAENIKVAGWVNIELADLKGLEKSAEQILEKYPDLELLINNAGVPGNMAHASYETDIKDIQQTININYIGTYYLTKLLLPVIQRNSGRIVNITVPSEVSPYWHPLAYVASKAAQNAMTSIMSMEFTDKHIPVEIYDVHPGPTTTDLNGNMTGEGFHTPDTIGEKVAELIADGKSHQGEFIELYPIVKE